MVCIANELDKKVPVIKKNVVITKIGDESVINPSFEDEVEPYVITLNATGTFLLNEINGKNSINDIIQVLIENYYITEKDARNDLFELIKDLEEGNIIVWKN